MNEAIQVPVECVPPKAECANAFRNSFYERWVEATCAEDLADWVWKQISNAYAAGYAEANMHREEMLRALIKARDDDASDIRFDTINTIRAAIAKATGAST